MQSKCEKMQIENEDYNLRCIKGGDCLKTLYTGKWTQS
jgi:hypothetical protein